MDMKCNPFFLESPVKRTIVDRFKNMVGGDLLRSVQIGDGAGHPQNAVVGPRTQTELVDRMTQMRFRLRLDGAEAGKIRRFHPGVAADSRSAGKPLLLPLSRPDHPGADLRTGFARRRMEQFVVRQRRHFHMKIDPVQQRS